MGVTPNRFEIGPMTNFGRGTRRSIAMPLIMRDQWAKLLEPVDVHYSEHLGAMILRPDPALRDMAVADWICSPSNIIEVCRPENTGADHLCSLVAQANYATSITSRYSLTSSPCITLSLDRLDTPLGFERAQRFTLAFAQDYTLTWGGDSDPVLTKAGGTVEVARLHVQEGATGDYYQGGHQRIEILNVLGKLFVIGLGETWIIPDIGDLPAAQVQFICNGGAWAANITQQKFARTGTFKTKSIEHFETFPDGDMIPQVYPAPQGGTTVTVSVVPGSTGTQKQYQFELKGTGFGTPVLSLGGGYFLPEYDEPTDTWTDISAYKVSARESKPAGMTSDTCDLTLSLLYRHEGLTLIERLGVLQGQYAFRYYSGPVGSAGELRMTGLLKIRTPINGQGAPEVTITAVSRWAQLAERKLLFPPCMANKEITDAISLTGQWCSFRPADIVTTGVTGRLEAPERDGMDNPPWLAPNGTPGADWLGEIARASGNKIIIDEQGRIIAKPSLDVQTGLALTTQPGTPYSISMSAVENETDLTDVENHIIVEGRTPDGDPIYAGWVDEDAMWDNTSPRYIGYTITRYITDANLTTPRAVNEALAAAIKERSIPQSVNITSDHPESALCLLWPNNIITVYDAVTGTDSQYRVISVDTDLGKARNIPTIRAEIIDA